MVWPTGTVSNTNVDAATDSPANARGDLYSLIDKVNSIITSQPKIKTLLVGVLDMRAYTKNVWTSVGPTGSGATIIWDAMDQVPTDVTGVMLKVLMEGNTYAFCRARKDGETNSLTTQQTIFHARSTGFISAGSGDSFVEHSAARRIEISVDYGTWDLAAQGFWLILSGYYR